MTTRLFALKTTTAPWDLNATWTPVNYTTVERTTDYKADWRQACRYFRNLNSVLMADFGNGKIAIVEVIAENTCIDDCASWVGELCDCSNSKQLC